MGKRPQRNRNARLSVSRVSHLGAFQAHVKRLIVARDGGTLFGVLMGVLHGGEPLTLKTLVGMALTIGGIVVLTIG